MGTPQIVGCQYIWYQNRAKNFPIFWVFPCDFQGFIDRIVKLLPIARNYYPSQHGRWSIKAVLPAVCPDLTYSDLDGVQDGHMAISAYQEAINPETSPERKTEINIQLDRYPCHGPPMGVFYWQVE